LGKAKNEVDREGTALCILMGKALSLVHIALHINVPVFVHCEMFCVRFSCSSAVVTGAIIRFKILFRGISGLSPAVRVRPFIPKCSFDGNGNSMERSDKLF
jgi:hypothetical protein